MEVIILIRVLSRRYGIRHSCWTKDLMNLLEDKFLYA